MSPVSQLQGEFLYAAQTVAEHHGLTPARWQVLGAAAATPSSVADIARVLGLARQSVQRVADDLTEAGLATWAVNPRHARAKWLVPTHRGTDVLQDTARDQAAWADGVTERLAAAGITDADVARAEALLNRMVRISQNYWDEQENETA